MVVKFLLVFALTLIPAVNSAYANERVNNVMWSNRAENRLGIPLRVFSADPTKNTVAIFYSGDAGWQNIDEEVANYLQRKGSPSLASIHSVIFGPNGLQTKLLQILDV